MSSNFDVVIVGAGPVGITTATTLKALNKDLLICVLDKRELPSRNHGLNIQSDSVNKIIEVMDKAVKDSPSTNHSLMGSLKSMFVTWKNNFIRTKTIEEDLGQKAREMGITLLRGKDYELTDDRLAKVMKSPEEIQEILDHQTEEGLPEAERISPQDVALMRIFQHAKVVMGCDSAHSIVREKIMGLGLTEDKTMQHVIELKYQTNGATRVRNLRENLEDSCYHGHLDIETMNRQRLEDDKPVTLHVFVDEETFKRFRPTIDGKLKGVFGNSWTMQEIAKFAETDEKIRDIYHIFCDSLKKVCKREGTPHDEQITSLPIRIYRSEKSVKLVSGRAVILAGDANSGLILARGFNKGLMEAALSAQAVHTFFAKGRTTMQEMPEEFTSYQEQSRKMFENEKWWIEYKSSLISAVRLVLQLVAKKIPAFFSAIGRKITNLFSKKIPT